MRSRIKRWHQTRRNGRPWRRLPLVPLQPEASDRTVRLVTLNVAHGRKLAPHQALLSETTVRRNLQEIGATLSAADADIIALQEADGPSAWSGRFDHVEVLAGLGANGHHYRGEHNPFAIGRANLTAGTALLARYPLRQPESHRFATHWRDTKGFVVATIEIPQWQGACIDAVSVHLDAMRPWIRARQIDRLTSVLAARDRPIVLMGDFNCSWSEEAAHFRPLVQRLQLRPYQPYRRAPTYPSRRPFRRLDWILVSPELEFAGYRTLPNAVSDHLGVVAEIRRSKVAPAVATRAPERTG